MNQKWNGGGDNVLKDCLNIQWSLDQVTLIDLKL